MAWIETIDYEDADEKLKELYDVQPYGKLHNIEKVHGLMPNVLEALYSFFKEIHVAPSPLSRRRREMIAVVVSSLNECHY